MAGTESRLVALIDEHLRQILNGLVLLAVSAPAALAGQEPGETVRVNGEYTGEFIRADSVGLHLSFGIIPYGTLESLEIKVGRRSLLPSGMRHGAIYGAGAGVVLGGVSCALAGEEGCLGAVLSVTAGLAGYGTVIGALVGVTMWRDRFDSIDLPIPVGLAEVRPGPVPRSLSIGYRVPIG